MKVIFWGTPDFAILPLQKIYDSTHEIAAVVTVADKKQGRGMHETASPVKQWAVDKKIPVLQPETLTDAGFITELQSIAADVFVVVAFKILPPEIFTIPRFGSFNLHASLLPKFRGAAPIQWALMKGEKETGVTTFKLEQKVDTGNIYLQRKTTIDVHENFGTLHDKLSILGADAVKDTLDLIESGNFVLLPQDNSLATPAPKIKKETCLINWANAAEQIINQIKGLSPFPGAYFIADGIVYKVFEASMSNKYTLLQGEFKSTKDEIFVGTGEGTLQILSLQKEGRKRMIAEEFLRGYRL